MKMTIPIIQVLVTDHCNQNCSFCFAKEEMKSPLKKEFSLEDFRGLVKKCRKNGIARVALSGGEPTIHTQFDKILSISLDNFYHVYINTNGTFSLDTEDLFTEHGSRITLFFNISTPGFLENRKIRDLVLRRIERLGTKTNIVLVVTSKFLTAKVARTIVNKIPTSLTKQVAFRLGVEGVVCGDKNYTTISDFPRIGESLFSVYKYVEELGPKSIILAKSITPCMFTTDQLRYLKSKKQLAQYHCHPQSEGLQFTITPTLETFMCYPLSTRDRIKLSKTTNFLKLGKQYKQLQRRYNQKYVLPECENCPFYGTGVDKCPGPCISFRMNALTQAQVKTA